MSLLDKIEGCRKYLFDLWPECNNAAVTLSNDTDVSSHAFGKRNTLNSRCEMKKPKLVYLSRFIVVLYLNCLCANLAYGLPELNNLLIYLVS